MSSKLKKHKLLYKVKAIISSLVIAFFFSSFIILLITLTLGPTLKKGLNIINTVSLEMNYGSNDNVKFDIGKKKLTKLPSWGATFGSIKIPSISVDLALYHGDDTPQLARGVGHSAFSQFPGEGGSVLLAAHNSKGLFYTLPQIKVGDKIFVETIYGNFQYEVFNTAIADYRNEDAFPIQNDYEMLILYTCYPVDNLWYVNDRFVVYAKLVGDDA